MELETIVVPGDWICDENGQWDFIIDRQKMCTVVHFNQNNTLLELSNIVLFYFKADTNHTKVTFSYLSPDLVNLGIGRQCPPVILSTDACLGTYCRHFLAKKITNLYAVFVPIEVQDSFITPLAGQKRKIPNSVGGCTLDACNSRPTTSTTSIPPIEVCMETPEFLEAVDAIVETMGNSRKKPLRQPCTVNAQTEVNAIAATMGNSIKKPLPQPCTVNARTEVNSIAATIGNSIKEPLPQPCTVNAQTDENNSNCSGDTIESEDVCSRGYDKDFWGPLLEETFGGSNALAIMLAPEIHVQRPNLSSYQTLFNDTPGAQQTDHRFPNRSCDSQGEAPSSKGAARGSQGQASSSKGPASSSKAPTRGQCSSDVPLPVPDDDDIPPLFDDLQYPKSVIPDLDLDDNEELITVGRTFVSKAECQIALAIFAIRNMFYFKQRRTTKTNFVVTCADISCPWLVNAHKLKENLYYRIKTASLEHTCTIDTRSNFTKKATSEVIAHLYKSKFSIQSSGPKPKDLQQLVLEELGVPTTYSKCWRANQLAHDDVRGTEEESYLKVEEYLHLLVLANPGSVTAIETETDDQGLEKFLYLFLAFGASIEGFKMLRPVIVVDGTHLTGKYRGILLTASGQDANFQVFPLAFAIVDAENDASWNWFLTKLKDIIPQYPSFAIISDRHQSILKAVSDVFKNAKHGGCIAHLSRNVASRFKTKGLAKLVTSAACAYRVRHFKFIFGNIQSLSTSCANWLEELGFENWSRAYFKGNRYNLMTSNIAESLNNALRKARRSTIIDLLKYIQTMLMRWFNTRRDKAIAHTSFITPEVDRLIKINMKFAKGSKVTSATAWSSEVIGKFGRPEYVELEEKRCTCLNYDIMQIPCSHALLVAADRRLNYGPLVGEHYLSSCWKRTYKGIIRPNGDPGDIDIPLNIRNREILPPRAKRPCGRPRVKRIPSTGEYPDAKNQRKCGRCGILGHNKTSCKNPIG